MASKLKISIEAEVAKARAELETIRNSVDKMKESQGKANASFDSFLKGGKFLVAAKVAIEAIKKITKAVGEMIAAYRETELANARLSGILRATGRATEFAGNQMGQMADELARLSTFTTTEITNAQALLLAYDNIGNDTFPDVLKSAMDLSAAFGTDLNSSIQKLGRALNDPTTGFRGLRSEGIALSKEKEELINTLVEENKMYEAQKVLLDELKDRYGGLSEEIAQTGSSKLDKLKNTLEDIKGEFGRVLLDKFDGAIGLGSRIAEGFLDKVSSYNDKVAENKRLDALVPDLSSDRKYGGWDYLDLVGDHNRKHEAFYKGVSEIENDKKPFWKTWKRWNEDQKQRMEDYFIENADTLKEIQEIWYEITTRGGEDLQKYHEEQMAKAAQSKTDAQAYQRLTSPADLWEEKPHFGPYMGGIKDYLNDPTLGAVALNALEEFGGVQWEIFNLEEEKDKIEALIEAIIKDFEKAIGASDLVFTEEEKTFIDMALAGLKEALEDVENKIIDLQTETTEWDEVLGYIAENQNLIVVGLDEQILALEEEILKNRELLGDEEAKKNLTTEQLDALKQIVESKEEQLQGIKDEVSGLKEVRDFISQNKNLTKDTNEEKIKAIDAQIDYNTELLKTVGLTTAERKELEDILNLLKEQKDEMLDSGGFGEKTWGSIVSDWGKDSAYGDFISKLTTEINALEQAFGNTFSTIQGLAVSLGDAILDSMRTALTEIEKTLREKTELYEEKEREERGIRDESLNALQEQYDADAISYEEFMDRKQEIDDLYDENTKDALDAMTEAEEEAARKRDELARKEFEANKRNSIANALINGAMAVVRAFSDLGPIAGAIAGATIGALTTAQVAIIGQQSYVPALAEGGVATGPTLAMIGEGREPELVLPLSKAKQFGFGGSGQQIIVRVENNTIYGIDDFGERAYEAIRSAQRVGRVPRNAF